MPAPKKTTSKATKAAPKKKAAPAKKAATSAAKKTTAAPKKTVAAATPKAKAAAAPKKAPAAAKKASTSKTTKSNAVVAQIDVGFGNRLTIRGEGAGLSWTAGQTMDYTDGSWSWKPSKAGSFEFKVLLNDEVWAQGENICADGKSKVAFVPQF